MTVKKLTEVFTKQELEQIMNQINATSERNADFLIGMLKECYECGENIFESLKQLIVSGKTIGLARIPQDEACTHIIIQQVDKNIKVKYLIFKENPEKEIKKLLLKYYPSSGDVLKNILHEAKNDPDSEMMDTHSYIRLMVDVYDEDPETQTGEMYLICDACNKCNVE